MTGNYLKFAYFDSLMAVMVTFVFLFIVPSIVLFLFFVFISDNNYKKIKTTINNLNLDFFLSSYAIIGLLLVIFSPILLYPKTTDNNFNNVYDVKFIEKSPISEIQYSKKDNFNTSTILHSLYETKGTLYIVKDPKSDNYFVSDKQDIVMKAANGEIRNNLDRITFSKEDIKKTIGNKVDELPVVKESEFK